MEMSGKPRDEPTTDLTLFWYDGREKTVERPPLPAAGEPNSAVSFHTAGGCVGLPLASRKSSSPPTPVTSGSSAGHSATRCRKYVSAKPCALNVLAPLGPASPAAASTVTPWAAAFLYALRRCSICAAFAKVGSGAAKLWVITSPRW